VHLLAKIWPPPAHLCAVAYRQTPQGKIYSYNLKYAFRPFVKHTYAFANALPEFLHAKTCKAENHGNINRSYSIGIHLNIPLIYNASTIKISLS